MDAAPSMISARFMSLKSHFVYATVAVSAACQTPPASNQGTQPNKPAALIGQSASPSSQYEADSFGALQPASIRVIDPRTPRWSRTHDSVHGSRSKAV